MHRQGALPELLIPASGLGTLKVAVHYGADAVYMSGKSFGLRTFSDNFTHEEMKEGVEAKAKKLDEIGYEKYMEEK